MIIAHLLSEAIMAPENVRELHKVMATILHDIDRQEARGGCIAETIEVSRCLMIELAGAEFLSRRLSPDPSWHLSIG